VKQPAAVAGNARADAPGEARGGGVLTARTRLWLATDSVLTSEQVGAPAEASGPDTATAPYRRELPPDGARPNGGGEPTDAREYLVSGLRTLVNGFRRLAGRHVPGGAVADEFGFDPEFNARVLIPVARFFYQQWFRVRMRGLEHVPPHGPALVVPNHSGTLPVDAVMLQAGLYDEHPAHRNLRLLGADLLYEIPLLAEMARKGGHARATPANADALLRAGELVGVFPEGFKGIGKPFAERYQLQRFGRGGFAATAIRSQVPLIPCAIVGAEEIYPMVGNAKPIAEWLGLPYFPITPMFPWLGPIGVVPLPSRWIIEFCPPVPTDCYAPDSAADPAVIADLSGRIRGTIQRKLDDLLDERGPAFG
jgi:1-acyl-sn-glycerol-3-phosphate acyltransferase